VTEVKAPLEKLRRFVEASLELSDAHRDFFKTLLLERNFLSRLQKVLSQRINLLTRSCPITHRLFAGAAEDSSGECIDRHSQLTGQWTPSHGPLRRLF